VNWHAVDKGFFQPTTLTVFILHFFAVKAMLRSHPGDRVVSLFTPSLSEKRFTTKANFAPPQPAQHFVISEDNFVCNPTTTSLWWDIPSQSSAGLIRRSSHKSD